MKRILSISLLCFCALITSAQQAQLRKLSPMLRSISAPEKVDCASTQKREVCAFVRITGDGDDVLRSYGGRSLTKVGNIYIASIPVSSLRKMSLDSRIIRVEARPMATTQLDSVGRQSGVVPVHQGIHLPQAFTGRGVVVGLMDIGFDLTHPNFLSAEDNSYRIHRMWDMLANDTVGSGLYVGRDYTSKESLLALQHSRDGEDFTHGTYTLGIATGSGCGFPYQGVAYESDICLVANATSNNSSFIDPSLHGRYTFATDALGFKYMFDYARSINKPCVISFSEGSPQDFWGYDQLFYEMLDSMQGPGRIIVSAAGNNGYKKSWFRKPVGEQAKGTFLQGWQDIYCTLKSDRNFLLRLVAYGDEHNDTLLIPTSKVLDMKDSLLRSPLTGVDSVEVLAYPSCYVPEELCYDVTFYSRNTIGYDISLSLEVIGIDADVELWRGSVSLVENTLNPLLNAGESTHSLLSPATAPRVICVGSTFCRDSVYTISGEWKGQRVGEHGLRANFSSIGPTMDGRIKPDVMAPGCNIISSFNSFFLEKKPNDALLSKEMARFVHNGRTYSWTADDGTSASCPIVAGIIALWLQAKPDLTPEDVMDVIRHTSRQVDSSLDYPNNEYGYGEIDAYRGLLYLLGFDQLNDVSVHPTCAHIDIRDHHLIVRLPEQPSPSLRLRLYDLNGRLQCQFLVKEKEEAFLLPHSFSGIYAVQLDGVPAFTGSSLIRL